MSSMCATCHGPDGEAPRSDHHELVRHMRDQIQKHRYSLALVDTIIDYTANPERRSELMKQYDNAAEPLSDAIAAWHAFSFDAAVRPLEQAEKRIQALLDDLTVR